MGYFKKEGRFGGKPKYGGERADYGPAKFVKREPGRLELFDATCAKCRKRCQVPFKPTNNKPVYCRDCFGSGDSNPRERFSPRENPSSNPRERSPSSRSSELDEINRKLDKIMDALDID